MLPSLFAPDTPLLVNAVILALMWLAVEAYLRGHWHGGGKRYT